MTNHKFGIFPHAGNGEVQQQKWLVAACAAAGSSADMALNKGALHLSLDPTAVIAVLLEHAGTEVSVVPASGAPLQRGTFGITSARRLRSGIAQRLQIDSIRNPCIACVCVRPGFGCDLVRLRLWSTT